MPERLYMKSRVPFQEHEDVLTAKQGSMKDNVFSLNEKSIITRS